MSTITDREFVKFQRFIFDAAGITLAPTKKALVGGRLAKRLQQRQLKNYEEYFQLLQSGHEPQEVQTAIDLLTTNETYFFREPKHFDLLRAEAQQFSSERKSMRVWSAAASTGEEPYSIAMVLADCFGMESTAWEVLGSDLSMRVLQKARIGHYPLRRTAYVPKTYLQRYCLKGTGVEEGTLLIGRKLRERVRFAQVNLSKGLPQLGQFDIVFLRNVMIYFNLETKRQVVSRVLSALRPGGYLFIGHSESLHDINHEVQVAAPSVYRKPLP